MSNLQTILTLLASMGGVAGLLAYLRKAGLDRLLSGLDATQQNAILRGLLILLNFGAILAGLLAQGNPMSQSLLLQAVQMTAAAVVGGHLLFTGLQKDAPQAPEIDPSVYAQFPPSPPPTDSPESAALDPAA